MFGGGGGELVGREGERKRLALKVIFTTFSNPPLILLTLFTAP
jgi:hypothetical protein